MSRKRTPGRIDAASAHRRRISKLPLSEYLDTFEQNVAQMDRMFETFWKHDTLGDPARAEKSYLRAKKAVEENAPNAERLVQNFRGLTFLNYVMSDSPCFPRHPAERGTDTIIEIPPRFAERLEDLAAVCLTHKGDEAPELRRRIIATVEEELRFSIGDSLIPWDVYDENGLLIA